MKKIFLILISLNLLFANTKELYNTKCAPCHGINANKQTATFIAIKDLQDSLNDVLLAYKYDVNYGNKTRFAMQRIVKKLSDEEILKLSDYIKNL